MPTRADELSTSRDAAAGRRAAAASGPDACGLEHGLLAFRANPGGGPMRSWIAAGVLAVVLTVGLALPAEAGHRHSRTCGHRYSSGYSDRYEYGHSNRYGYRGSSRHAYRHSGRYRYPRYDYGYRYRYSYNPAPYGYHSPYAYGAPYVMYAPPPPAFGFYYAASRRHVRPRLSVTLGLW